MAQTYVPIKKVVLTGTTASVDFENIPQNYTDLKLVMSVRNNDNVNFGNILVGLNGSTSSYTNRYLQGSGSSVGTGQVSQMVGDMDTSTATSSAFSNIEVYFYNYNGSTYKLFSADSVAEDNGSTSYMMFNSNIWASNQAITKITVTNRNGGVSFTADSTFTLYGIGAARASGGTITADSNYTYHTFTSSSTFTALENIKNAEALIIAGGGGGGKRAGGGGAGGLVYSQIPLFAAANTYSVIVGSGGSGSTSTTSPGSSGTTSQLGSLTQAVGGGGGGSVDSRAGVSGGSGGGTASGSSSFGTGTAGQGNNGGSNSVGTAQDTGAGGGGAGGVGGNGNTTTPGDGGVGSSAYSSWGYATITGQNLGGTIYYAGGGGGAGNSTKGSGGAGGGGAGQDNATGFAGTANTGGGGGGGGNNSGGPFNGGAGGSGIVIIRYPN